MFKKTLKTFFIILAFLLSFMAFFSGKWYYDIYGNIGFQSILFTLLSPMEGTASDIVYSWLLRGLLPTVIFTLIAILLYFLLPKKCKVSDLFKKIVSIILCLCLWGYGATVTGIPTYLSGKLFETSIYENYYISPDSVKITFPQKKQNLIYIYLESMETTYLSTKEGGGLSENTIPELYNLASQNLNFSHNNGIGGYGKVTSTTWTSAAMVAHTSGVPLSLPIKYINPKKDSNFLPNIKTLTNILNKNGYYQALMFGSKASYGGRGAYYSQHSVDKIYDYYTAIKDKIIPKNYFVWWGFEDYRLFDYAKTELTKISAQEKPFAFTLLTADTHHIAGYKCKKCNSTYDSQYKNCISCSSKQVYEFIEWIKQQDFYKNTTVIITGDHLSMDAKFFKDNMTNNFSRNVYNCFINSKATTKNNKNRIFTPMDMFPTTLAAIGCEIEGERLGLGTNLFSQTPTLAEEIGIKKLNKELNKKSTFYVETFIN